MNRQHAGELPPTTRQLECLASYLRWGSHRIAAHHLGIVESNSKNLVHEAIARVGAESATEAAILLGWLTLPDEAEMRRWAAVHDATERLRRDIAKASAVLADLEAVA